MSGPAKPKAPPVLLWGSDALGERLVLVAGVVRAEQYDAARDRWRTRLPVNVERQIRDRAIVDLVHRVKRASTPPPALVVARCAECGTGHTAADVLASTCRACGAA